MTARSDDNYIPQTGRWLMPLCKPEDLHRIKKIKYMNGKKRSRLFI